MTTPSVTPAISFETALATFLAVAQDLVTTHYRDNYKNLEPEVLSVEMGNRYARIVTKAQTGRSRSVYCFVDRTNGDILKAASWKAPAKGARGSVFAPDFGRSCITPYGAVYKR